MSNDKKGKHRILFQLTGSIACYKSCYVLSRLVQSRYDVQVVASKGALEFIGRSSLEGLTGHPVHVDTFEPGRSMAHVHLAKWADLTILCPATANAINKMAAGISDDLISTLFLAHDLASAPALTKPYLVAPAMNTAMYHHPATQASLKKLREWGVSILETASGVLACGDVGEGRLLDPDLIFAEIERALTPAPAPTPSTTLSTLSTPLHVLITSGGTREPIDGVRSIANFSSGRTGAAIAEFLHARGHRVTFLHARDSALPATHDVHTRIHTRSFVSFSDLRSALEEELGAQHFDAIIHLAAVSDFSVDSIEEANGHPSSANGRDRKTAPLKIESDVDLTIHLKRNPKLVDRLREFSRHRDTRIIAFKLTNGASAEERLAAVRKLSARARPDWIVHNDLTEIASTGDSHISTIYAGSPPVAFKTAHAKTELAAALAIELERHLTEDLMGEKP